MTLEQIGAWMCITRERVRQIEKQALRKLLRNTGDDIAWIGKRTMSIPECEICGEAYVRERGRQVLCPVCESTSKRKRPAIQQPSLRMSAH